MKKVLLLLNLLFLSISGNAESFVQPVKNNPVQLLTSAATGGRHHHFKQFSGLQKPFTRNQPDAPKLSNQAAWLAILGVSLTAGAIIFTFFTYVITSLPLFVGMLIIGGIAGIFGISKARKVLRNNEADENSRKRAKIALIWNIVAVFLALLPAIAILLEPLWPDL